MTGRAAYKEISCSVQPTECSHITAAVPHRIRTTMIGLLIYNNAFEYGKYGLACAQAILLAIVIALMSLVQFKMMGVDVEY